MSTKPASPVIRFIQHIAESPVVDDWSDGRLLEQFTAQRDEASFAAIVRRHGPLVLSVCRRVLQHEHDAEDAFQATFLVLVRKAGAIGKREALGNWLYGVAYRIALKAKAVSARRRTREGHATLAPVTDLLDELAARELSSLLNDELGRLPEKYRAPLMLCCLLGKTTDEAAHLLGWPRGTVGIRVARARELLRTRLVRRGVALSSGLLSAAYCHTSALAMPPNLMTRTVDAALLTAGHAEAVAVSPHVLSLVKGAVQAMMMTKMKIALAIAIAVAVAGTGSGLVSYHALTAGAQPTRGKPERQLLAKVALDDKDAKKDDSEAGEPEPNRDEAADKTRSQNNLKQIGLALHNYHDANGHFPAAALYDKNDKPLLSWRVALLPYLAATDLYQQFKLDESWDSEDNKKLLEKMPDVFKAPGIKTKKPYTTYYQLIVGKGAMFEGVLQVKIPNITDGTSNTIMTVEAEKPVPWTKPEDLAYDPEKALPKLGGVFPDGFNFLTADAAAHFCMKGFDEKKMRAAITRAGGELVDIGHLEP